MATDDTADGPRSALRFPWAVGLVYGGLAYVAGYLVTLAVLIADWSGPDFPPDLLRTAGYVFYGAHGVPITGPGGVALHLGFWLRGGDTFPALAYTLIPVAVLLVTGAAVARGFVGLSAQQAVLAGASVSVGYAALSVMGVYGFAADGFAPALVESALLMGVVLPAVAGAVGGYVGR